MKIRELVVVGAIVVVVFGGIWLTTWFVMSPYQRFMIECGRTHLEVDCHTAWHKAQAPIVVPP